MGALKNIIKVLFGFFIFSLASIMLGITLMFLLPSRTIRIRACNFYGHIIGRFGVWLVGCNVVVDGKQHLAKNKPAIYIINHTSMLDIFIAMWLVPTGTAAIAKKGVIKYPFFGQAYLLSGSLRVDRSGKGKSIEAIKNMARFVRQKSIGIMMFPEGTRSKNGRLLPFKKGVIHLALQTRLPIIPIIVENAHNCWQKATLSFKKGHTLKIKILEPIDTSSWDLEELNELLELIREPFYKMLPNHQQPLALPAKAL